MNQTLILTALLCTSSSLLAGTLPLDPVLTVHESGFSSPVAVRNAGDGSNRLFVVQQGGLIRTIDASGNTLPMPFLDIDDLTNGGGERGLLGLAFHPNYGSNSLFYVNYTNLAGDTTIAAYTDNGDPNVPVTGAGTILLTIDQDFSNHNGGDLHFGLDGYLYIGMGDGGDGNDPCNRGQTIDPADLNNTGSCAPGGSFGGNDDSRALLGALLRIDVDNPGVNTSDACGEGVNYGIPADNPFTGVGDGACDEIYAWGLRNPYRFTVDRQTGDLFIGDVGQGAREEVSFLSATSGGGENFGWRCREGFIATPGISCTAPGAVDPILDYPSTGNRCSVVSGYRYRGPEFTWTGTYLYADYCSGDIYYSVFNGGWSAFDTLISTFTNVTGFGEDEAGNMYLTNFNGEVVRISDGNFDSVNFIFDDGFEGN